MIRIGYACDCISVKSVYKTLRLKTFHEKGLDYCSKLSMDNLLNVERILEWNIENQIKMFRMGCGVFPADHLYQHEELPDFENLKIQCLKLGNMVKNNDIRLNLHPSAYCVLGSISDNVAERSALELNQNSKILDLFGLDANPYHNVNIHMSTTQGGKREAMDRFIERYNTLLGYNTKLRITLENDDKASAYSVRDLMYIHEKTGIPIVFDYHHHRFCDGGLSEKDALQLALSTWTFFRPETHYSETRRDTIYGTEKTREQAHSDYIENVIPTYNFDEFDITIEAKKKDLTVLEYRKILTNNKILNQF